MNMTSSSSISFSALKLREEDELSTSPASVVSSPLLHHYIHNKLRSKSRLNLEEFVDSIPLVIEENNKNNSNSNNSPLNNDNENDNDNENFDKEDTTGSSKDPIAETFNRLDLTNDEIDRYCFIEPNKKYTRNLIATDNHTFTLLLLCWNPHSFSLIHDHPCQGCWMRVLKGAVNEQRFVKCKNDFVCTMDTTLSQGESTFINDDMGYHKIGNNGDSLAISLHLYSPPFQTCQVWNRCTGTDTGTTITAPDPNRPCIVHMSNYSEFGSIVQTD